LGILETERLILRHLAPDDAPFILELLNDPGWLRYIGDRGVRTLQQAVDYIETVPMAMYANLGFGLYLTARRDTREPIGMCGLLKRDALDDVDIGFAFLQRYQGQGYGFEAASAVLEYARTALGLQRVVAIATRDNERSAGLLEKLGFRFERMVTFPGDGDELRLFASRLADRDPAPF